jgi:acyl carrier protein
MPISPVSRPLVARAVRRRVIAESRVCVEPSEIADDEPLNGSLLRVNSLGFVGMLIHLEDELGITLADDLFVGRTFQTVADLVDAVAEGAR